MEEDGYKPATSAAGADVVLLNTCSVREKSSEKLFGFLGRLKHPRKILIHVNNTNPILDEGSAQRALLAEAGIEVAEDGMEIRL